LNFDYPICEGFWREECAALKLFQQYVATNSQRRYPSESDEVDSVAVFPEGVVNVGNGRGGSMMYRGFTCNCRQSDGTSSVKNGSFTIIDTELWP